MKFRSLIIFVGLFASISAFKPRRNIPQVEIPEYPEADYGEPLFLTPYIQQGLFAEAKNLSRVGPLNGTNKESYTGYLTVDPAYNSNIFFWYFPAEVDPATAPVAVWLQGGPGSSSMFGLFGECGPFAVDSDINLYERPIHWAKTFNMIFIDNPVGAGFSFTDSDDGYANNQVDVGEDLYEALLQFFTLFSELQTLDFYITGESYAGKYIPAISYKIMQENPTASLKINLKGFAIGDGWTDPVTQFDYGDYLYNVGFIDKKQRQQFYEIQISMVQHINEGNYLAANTESDLLMSLYTTYSGSEDVYNYLRWNEPIDQNYYYLYLTRPDVRKSMHVGNSTFSDGNACYTHLMADICQSTKPWLEQLLDNDYRILLYTGQVDVICAYYINLNMFYTLDWKGAEDYRNANRSVWRVDPSDNEIAGYVKNAQNFWEILVRDAGHILPYDQPRAGYDMITRFVFNKGFTN